MSESPDLTEYTVINIITGKPYTFSGEDFLYDDDTNLFRKLNHYFLNGNYFL